MPASAPGYRRARRRKLPMRRTGRLARTYAGDPVICRFTGRLDRAAGGLFRPVPDLRIPPANNAAERGLREIVVRRRIRGSTGSRETMRWMGGLFTCATAWKAMNGDRLAEILKRVWNRR